MRSKFLLLALAASCLGGPVVARPAPSATVAAAPADLDARVAAIAERFAQAPITGMTLAISRDGKPVYVKGFGLADVERGLPADASTVYEIGSITKQFTAAAVMRLVEQGRLGLDEPAAKYFPELAANAPGVTLRHLLSHTSGLYSGPAADDLTRPSDPHAVVAVLAGRPVESAPGERYRYNNNGFMLLGLLIEKISGRSYEQYLADEFFKPLGLRSTSACAWPAPADRAKGYQHPAETGGRPRLHPAHHPSVSYAAGELCSTAADLLTWQSALANGRVVSPQSWTLMTTAQPLAGGRTAPYGLGTSVDGPADDRRLHHGGAASGFITQMGWYPKDRLGVVVLTNGLYAGAIAEQIEAALAETARGGDWSPTPDLPLAADERARYVGRYAVGPIHVEVFEQAGHLRAQPTGQVATRLLYQGDGRFVAEHDPELTLTFAPGAGPAETLTLAQRGRALPEGRRVAAP